jgi:hypothetical protein
MIREEVVRSDAACLTSLIINARTVEIFCDLDGRLEFERPVFTPTTDTTSDSFLVSQNIFPFITKISGGCRRRKSAAMDTATRRPSAS